VRPLAADYLDHLMVEIGSPPDVAQARALTERLPISLRIEGPVVQWQSRPPSSATSGLPEHLHPRDSDLRALLVRTTADGHRVTFGMAAWQWQEHPRRFGLMTLAGLLVLTALAFAYVRHLFRPLDDIRAGALRYGDGDFSQPIPMRRPDELGELAHRVNQMAANLQRMLEGQRGLLLAISHELRSPLTRARLHAELVEEGPSRDALQRDLAVMRDLISDLLESERLARGAGALQCQATDLNALVRAQVERQCQGTEWPVVTLALAADLPVTTLLDRSRLELLLRNLLDNALRHGGATPITVGTHWRAESAQLDLTVTDLGPGVAPEQRAGLAQPFYRPDAARTRQEGGVGLGLYLCRLVAESHGGRLSFEDAAPGWRVRVRIPQKN
jgi:signal transduction histidine kinase